jgi:Ca-activated chloride channel family protein
MRPFLVGFRIIVPIMLASACSSLTDSPDTGRGSGSVGTSDADAASNGESVDAASGIAPTLAAHPPGPTRHDKGDAGADASACAELDASKPARLFLSADDSNSMASPVIARRIIDEGGVVPPAIVRTYEFLNYYNVPFAAPDAGTLALSLEARPGATATTKCKSACARRRRPARDAG